MIEPWIVEVVELAEKIIRAVVLLTIVHEVRVKLLTEQVGVVVVEKETPAGRTMKRESAAEILTVFKNN